MALQALCFTFLQLPSSGHRSSIPLAPHVVRPVHLSQRRLRPPSLPATACISLQLPSSGHRPSIGPPTPHVVRPVHLSPHRLRPLSSPTTASSAFYSASAALPLASRSSHNIEPLDELLETDGAGLNGGSSGRGAVGDHDSDSNRKAELMVPPRDDWPPENPPADSDGSERFFELEKSPLPRWLLRFGGIKERLLADDLFLAKVAMEYGLGIFHKAMALMADFMLVHLLPAPTASLPPALLAKFFHGCPDNAFQIALPRSSYSLTQRLGSLAISGGKLFAVGTASSMVRTAMRNALLDERNVAGGSSGGEVENIPILSTGLASGVHMAISDNLRSQVLDSVIEQWILQPLLRQHKLMLVAVRFAIRTGNTFFGSLL